MLVNVHRNIVSIFMSVNCPITRSIAIELLTKRGRGATKEFQSNRKYVIVPCSSRYLSSRRFGKTVGKRVNGVC